MVADLQDVLVYSLKGLALLARRARAAGRSADGTGTFIMKSYLDSPATRSSSSPTRSWQRSSRVFGAVSVNDLPIDFAIAWYEQKGVCVLVALLVLGFKGVRIGPTLPAFVSENVKQVLIERFGLKATAEVESDLRAIAGA